MAAVLVLVLVVLTQKGCSWKVDLLCGAALLVKAAWNQGFTGIMCV